MKLMCMMLCGPYWRDVQVSWSVIWDPICPVSKVGPPLPAWAWQSCVIWEPQNFISLRDWRLFVFYYFPFFWLYSILNFLHQSWFFHPKDPDLFVCFSDLFKNLEEKFNSLCARQQWWISTKGVLWGGKSGLVLSVHKHTGMSLFVYMWSLIVQFHPTKSTQYL